MKNKSTTVIEIDHSTIKVIQIVPSGKARALSHCSVLNLENAPNQELAKNLLSLLPGQHPRFCGRVIVGLTRHEFLFRYLRLPSHSDEEIARMVDFQTAGQIPYAREDVIFKHRVIQKLDDGYTLVEVAVVLVESVKRVWNILRSAGISPSLVTLDTWSFLFWHQHWLSGHKEDSVSLMCYVILGATNVEMGICQGEKLLFTRESKISGIVTTETAAWQLANQLQMTLATFRKEQGSTVAVQKVVLISSITVWEQFINQIQTEFNVPVGVLVITQAVMTIKDFQWPENVKGDEAILATSIGLGMVAGKDCPHFAPPELIEEKKMRGHKLMLTRVVILFLVMVILAGSILGLKIFRKQERLEHIDRETRMVNANINKLQKELQAVELLDEAFGHDVLFVELIAQLNQVWPKTTVLDSFKIAGRNEVVLQGSSSNSEDVGQLQSSLSASGRFANVVLDYANKRKTPTGEVTYFKITCRWKPEEQS